ncbi:hypothetical protein Tco_1127177, partial [Tanacetum coccineum]
MVVGESSEQPVKETTLTFQRPILMSTNYTIWRDDHVKEARIQTLITELKNMKMSDNDTIDAYAAKFPCIASKSPMLREVLDLKTIGFEDVVGRLKAYEERVNEEDKANDAKDNLLYVRTEYFNRNNDSSKGRGCGSYSRGRGHGRGQGSRRGNTQYHDQRDSLKNSKDNEQK